MKIRFYSDLHLEFGKFRPPDPRDSDTILVLAGDIGVKLGAMAFIEREAPKYRDVIYVAGNHEFYNGNYPEVLERLRNVCHIPNFHFLENRAVVIDNVKFLGATLWTDMKNDDWFVKNTIKRRMNDFQCIRNDSTKTYNKKRQCYFTPEYAYVLHKQTLDFFEKELSNDQMKTVIVTHHSPTLDGTDHERYGLSDMTYAYYTPLEYIMERYDHLTHWVFGHTHKTLDNEYFGTRVLSNPRGYLGHEVNPNFRPNWEIDV